MDKVLIAGSTGYLGKYLVKQLKLSDYYTVALARDKSKLSCISVFIDKIVEAHATRPKTLDGICKNIDIVVSSLGITRQKDGFSYMDVDYQANKNLLEEAKKQGVKKFIYISVLNGDKLRSLKICQAKEKFVKELKKSGLDYCIIRPNGFFSDMAGFYNMAKSGRIFLFGDGRLKANPIHGKDLAKVCVNAITWREKEIEVGGPETLTQNEIAQIAFEAAGERPRITHIPEWVGATLSKAARFLFGPAKYAPIEFFMSVMSMEMVAPEFGNHTLKDFFLNEV